MFYLQGEKEEGKKKRKKGKATIVTNILVLNMGEKRLFFGVKHDYWGEKQNKIGRIYKMLFLSYKWNRTSNCRDGEDRKPLWKRVTLSPVC